MGDSEFDPESNRQISDLSPLLRGLFGVWGGEFKILILYTLNMQLPAFSQAEPTYYAVPELQLGKC